VENAGLENVGPNRGTKSQGWKTRDWKTRDQIAGVEIAGLESGGPVLQGWKTQDNRLWNAKCLLMHKIQFHRTSQNTYISEMQLKAIVAPKRTYRQKLILNIYIMCTQMQRLKLNMNAANQLSSTATVH